MTTTAVIAAGGLGVRLGLNTPKQFLSVQGKPILIHTLEAFQKAETIDKIVVVLPSEELNRLDSKVQKQFDLTKVVAVIPGGLTRQESVQAGLEAIVWRADYVAIHDAARCLITPQLIHQTVQACKGWDGAIAALPIRDTLKRVQGETIMKTENRENIWAMQTPQVFSFPFIRDAYRKAKEQKWEATDDAALAELAGGKVRVVEGSARNIKITVEEDLKLAELLLKEDTCLE